MHLLFIIILLLPTRAWSSPTYWGAVGASLTSFSDLQNDKAKMSSSGKSTFFELSAEPWWKGIALQYKYRSMGPELLKLKNRPMDETDRFQIDTHELGIRGVLSQKKGDLYISAGPLIGKAQLNTEDRFAYGAFWNAGFHLIGAGLIGLKFEYQGQYVETNPFKKIQNKRLNFSSSVISIGFVLRLGQPEN